MRAIFQGRLNARTHAEINDCWFTSILCLSDQWIVVVDNLHRKIKIFNGNGNFISFVESTYMIGGVTAINNSKIAATCAEEINFYSIDSGKIELLNKRIDLNGTGSVIKFDGDIYAVVVCDILRGSREIQILDKKGQIKKTVRGQIFGFTLKDIRDLEMNKGKKEFYFTDLKTERVVCVSYEGKPVWVISIKGGPIGLLLRETRLIVPVLSQHCLTILSTTGDVCGEVKIENTTLKKPEHIAFQPVSKKIFITSYREENITMFTLALS